MEFRHSILLPLSLFSSVPRMLTHLDHSMKHTLGNLPDVRLWQSSLQLMSHLIRGGICFSRFNTAMSVTSVVDTGYLLLLILSQEDSVRVGNGTDGRHSRMCWQNGKVVEQRWMGSNRVCFTNQVKLIYS